MKEATDVLIIGAGPTGLSLAWQLHRYGIDFVIIEKSEGVTPYSKAIGVHARTLEIYEQIDLAQRAIDQGTIAGKGKTRNRIEILEKPNESSFLNEYAEQYLCTRPEEI